MKKSESEAAEYFSKDFEWEELRSEVESNPSLRHHFQSFSHSSTQSPESDVQAWKQFHTRHSSGKFFKERRYLLKEFPQLLSSSHPNSIPQKLLEVGCGNGSTILPILRANKDIVVYACDCSDETLAKAKEIINENSNAVDSFNIRFHPFCCDFSTTGFPNWLACNPCRDNFLQKQSYYFSDVKDDKGMHLRDSCSSEEIDCCIGGVDFITLIFTLSAVPLERMPRSIEECFTVLKPGGMVLFRDYGLYDMTMLRFEPDKRVGFREYMRSDGTRSYFFCLNTVRSLFLGAGFIELELDYCCVKSVNRRKGKSMQRVWVHAKFQKPVLS
ncbi:putative tRNA(Thr) (cytosine(32)-N(3))-methyltransferase [Medicago truncatula]|uniref:tRNA N(3)-methylcytidine methyltransferase n=1 Tax=Medicago truncatula TaxID=3880 RepID=G7I673_MEDTR|nr:tRNA N(3)-methylcytidine methyltransferase METTL6 isoform X2 [Medicago truncatula]AES61180.2 methyltransferase domain protein [Medicago truncatula]RHN80602.1 putative tRNA(Thr) (cytosine(32)-N(3))-methyltransferase [Medicago truncatula]